MSEKLSLKSIRTDGGTQSRAGLNDLVVLEYAEALRDGIVFPPLVVFHDGADYWLADGFHRHLALVTNGAAEADADVRQGTRRDAILFSVGANALHGLRRSDADKRIAVKTLLNDGEWASWSDREIARRCGVSHVFVAKQRPDTGNASSMARTFTHAKTGQPATMNTANIGGAGPNASGKVISEVLRLIKGTPLNTQSYRDKLKRLPPNEQVAAAKRDLAARKRADVAEKTARTSGAAESPNDGAHDFDPLAVRVFTAPKQDYGGLTADERIAELEEHVRALEADYAELVAENRTFADMRAAFDREGTKAILAAKDEEIRVLEERLYSESAAKMKELHRADELEKKRNYWMDEAKKRGWVSPQDKQDVPADYDDAFYAATQTEG